MLQLTAEELSKSFRGRRVVNNVSLTVGEGEVVGLLGPNGAGKTTIFHIVVGLIRPDTGRVRLNGIDLTEFPMYLRARHGLTYLPQEPSVFRKLTVEQNILAVAETLPLTGKQRQEQLEELLNLLGLTHLRKHLAYTLSGGERRRLEIARALVISPKFMLLDEPFSGIDPITVLEIQKIVRGLKAAGIGVLITDHNVRETLRVTDRANIIHNGKIFRSGTPQELEADPEVRRIYLGDHFQLH
ncbi:MAG: LPS export ABC transporter ATP-binding protein [Acidobacteria bacterium]|nr:LPS export ABC transporter ATP-binding protein [Acidobacteriota bacterium]